MIETIRYANEDGTVVTVLPQGWSSPYPCNTWHGRLIDQWVDGRTDEWDEQKAAYDEYLKAVATYPEETIPVVLEPPVLIPNTIEPYVVPVEKAYIDKVQELTAAFKAEAYADVTSNGIVWKGGPDSAVILDGAANKANHKGNVNGKIHSKDHIQHTLTPNQIKDVATAVGDAYEVANAKFQGKLLELDTCGNDTTCITNIVWGGG